jgi:hypothetical protein
VGDDLTSQRFVRSGELDLWTESFGDPSRPAVLLVMGAWNQGIVWPDEFCSEIAGYGYYVILATIHAAIVMTDVDPADSPRR